MKITDGRSDIAEFAYDALGRRIKKIRKIDSIATDTTLYYYNNRQVLTETDENQSTKQWYVYGNTFNIMSF